MTAFLQNIGLVSKNISYIPFLTSPGWAKFMIVLINIWVGIPYQILISTGILLNIPRDQIEAAMIEIMKAPEKTLKLFASLLL